VWLYSAVAAVVCLPVAVGTVVAAGQVPHWTWLATLVSGALHSAYFVLLQRGYATGDLSVVYPLARGTGPLLSVLAAVLLLRERPAVLQLVGAGVVVVGILVVGGLGSGPGRFRWTAGVGYGLATGVLIAVYTVWDAHAVTDLAVPPIVLLTGTVLFEVVLLSPVAVSRRGDVGVLWRAHWRTAITVAVLSPLAYILVLFAMRLAPVSLVAPARELSIVFGSLSAWLVLREPHPVRRLAGAVIVLAGVIAIAL
jgi:drug/metabolite transporter (DMT)-like permease